MSKTFSSVYSPQCFAEVTTEQRLCPMGAFRYAFDQIKLGAVFWNLSIVVLLLVILWMEHFA